MPGSLLTTTSKYFGPEETLDLPAIVFQVITGVGCYIVWAGTTSYSPPEGADATESEAEALVQQVQLGSDWACSIASIKACLPRLSALHNHPRESHSLQCLYLEQLCCGQVKML